MVSITKLIRVPMIYHNSKLAKMVGQKIVCFGISLLKISPGNWSLYPPLYKVFYPAGQFDYPVTRTINSWVD